MPPKKSKAPPAHAKSNPVKPGTVITDNNKLEIIVGKELTQGGFGRICDATIKSESGNFIIKFEPGSNGPLFVEQNVFIRILNKKDIDNYKQEKKIKFLGLPYLVSNGIYEKEIRYIVMPKYTYCLDELFKESGKFEITVVKDVVTCLLNSLAYLHSREYAHADIKAGNIMLNDKNNFKEVVLIDFGLAMKTDKVEDKENKKRAHNGSLFFTSVDAHRGIGPSYRGDIEILAHNMLLWLTGELPWLHLENKPDEVKNKKIKLINNLSDELNGFELDDKCKQIIKGFYEESKRLDVKEVPDFGKLANLFKSITSSNIKKNAKTKSKAVKANKESSPVVDNSEDKKDEDSEDKVGKKSKSRKKNVDEGKQSTKNGKARSSSVLPEDSEEEQPKKKRKNKEVEESSNTNNIIPGLSINRAGKEALKKLSETESATLNESGDKEKVEKPANKVIPGLNINHAGKSGSKKSSKIQETTEQSSKSPEKISTRVLRPRNKPVPVKNIAVEAKGKKTESSAGSNANRVNKRGKAKK